MKKRALGIIAAVVLAVASVAAPVAADADPNGKNCIGWLFSHTVPMGMGSQVSTTAKTPGGMPGALAMTRTWCQQRFG